MFIFEKNFKIEFQKKLEQILNEITSKKLDNLAEFKKKSLTLIKDFKNSMHI